MPRSFCIYDKPRREADILCSNRYSYFTVMKSGFHPTDYLHFDVFLTFSSFTPLKGGCFRGGFLCVGRLDSCRDHGSSDEQEKLCEIVALHKRYISSCLACQHAECRHIICHTITINYTIIWYDIELKWYQMTTFACCEDVRGFHHNTS